jgi:hypothetical protein
MNKTSNVFLLVATFIGFVSNTYAVGWTAEISDIRVWNNDKVEIFVSNPRDSKPAGAKWGCEDDLVLVGDPVSQSMLHTALVAFNVGKTIRMDVIGYKKSCYINYIQTKENKSFDKSK